MGFYVKGMEMPKDGYRQVFIDSNGTVTWFNNGADGPNTMYKAKAFPVQPHGRLIDADALEKSLSEELLSNDKKHLKSTWNDAVAVVFVAPTIIPASEVEDG